MITFAQCVSSVRARLALQNATHVTDDDIKSYLNASFARLNGFIINANENYNTVRLFFSIPSTEGPYDGYQLPRDVWDIYRVDRITNSPQPYRLDRINDRDENYYSNSYYWSTAGGKAYSTERNIDGYTILRIYPAQSKAGDYRILYYPAFQDYTNDADEIVMGPPGQHWEEYAILDTCIKICVLEETDPQGFMMQKQLMEKQIISEAAARDKGQSEPSPLSGPTWYDRVLGDGFSRGGGGW